MYSVFFGMAFAMAQAGSFFSIKWGALSITLLVTSYSLLIPALYGVLFLKERLSTLGIVGLVLLAISLFMIYDRKEKAMFSLKWLISVVIAFVGNGLCSTIQKMQQLAFDGGFKHEFMIMALAIFLYRERLTRLQLAGYLIGTASVVLLNL